jgi:hypothetical protein
MARTCLSIFAALSLLLIHLPPSILGQSTPASSPGTQTTQPNDPDKKPGNNSRLPGQRGSQRPVLSSAEKIKRAVEEIGVAQKITVILKSGNDDLHGAVTRIGKDEFEVAEVDFQRVITVQYTNVKKIRSGYGRINLFTGRRISSPPRGVGIAVTVGALFLVIGLPVIVLATIKD